MQLTLESKNFAFSYASKPWLRTGDGMTVCPSGIAIRIGWHVFTRRCGVGPLHWFDIRREFDEEAHKRKHEAEYVTAHRL